MLMVLPVLALATDAASEAAAAEAQAQDPDPDSWQDPEPTAEPASDEAAGQAAGPDQTARDAGALYALIARSLTLGASPFDGEPDAITAWALTYAALEQGAVEGMDEGQVSPEGAAKVYGMIFASGELPEMPEDFTLLKLEDGQYRQTSDPGDARYLPELLGAAEADGAVDAEVAVMAAAPDAPADLDALMRVTLMPDGGSPFGAKLSGFSPITGAPAMTRAEATATLKDYKKITYKAANALDGDFSTCWAYAQEHEGASIKLASDQPETVRGIRITPAYAKTQRTAETNNRVKSFHVALSDGASFDFTVQPDLPGELYKNFASFAFDGAHEITWATVRVTEVYPGSEYTDTCISEIALF
jgi:hypothetical protein